MNILHLFCVRNEPELLHKVLFQKQKKTAESIIKMEQFLFEICEKRHSNEKKSNIERKFYNLRRLFFCLSLHLYEL